jgi:hypothetical protein
MADLKSLLTDPNYINANDVTKQAIFDKFSAEDPNFVNANEDTRIAIRQKFGVLPPEPPLVAEPSTMQQLGRQAGLAGRAIVSGVLSPATMVGDLLAGGANLVQTSQVRYPSQTLQQALATTQFLNHHHPLRY